MRVLRLEGVVWWIDLDLLGSCVGDLHESTVQLLPCPRNAQKNIQEDLYKLVVLSDFRMINSLPLDADVTEYEKGIDEKMYVSKNVYHQSKISGCSNRTLPRFLESRIR